MKKLKFYYSRIAVIFLLMLSFSVTTKAQNRPVNVIVQVIPPYSPYFSDYIGNDGRFNPRFSDLIMVTVQNTDMNNSYQIKLIPEIQSGNNFNGRISPDFIPERPLYLEPGEVRVLNLSDLTAVNSNLSYGHINFSGISERTLMQTGVLPEGNYQLCMRAYDYRSSAPLSPTQPQGCSAPFLVIHPDPPVITYPPDGATIAISDPQMLQINWTPPGGGSGMYEYDVRMVELSAFQSDPYNVMNNSNLTFYREQNLLTPALLYDMSKPELEPGKTYALRVTAKDPDNEVLIKNDGRSEIHVFTVMPDTTSTTQVADDDVSDNDGSFLCGGACDFDLSNIDQTPVDTFSVGDIIKAGHFDVEITSANWSGNTLNGEGKILPGSFIPVSVTAELTNLEINAGGRIFEGKVQAMAQNTNFSNQSMLSDLGDQIDLPDSDLSALYDYLNDPGNLLANLQSDTEVQLPVGIGTPGDYYKVAVVGLILNPDKATFNTVSMIKLPDEQDKYLKLGSKNICINPGGIAQTDSATMFLMEDVQIAISDDVKLKLSKNDGSAGTFASFGCDGFGQIFAEGEFTLSPEVIRYENADGSQNETDSVKLSFATSFSDWSDWLVSANLFNQSRRYQFPEMEDYSFRIQNAVLDHSDLRNDAAMVFPQQYASTDQNATWKGLYIKTFNMMMPRFIDKNGNERIEVTGSNILIDQHGVSTFIEADNLLTRNEGSIGTWEFSVDYMAMELVASQLDSAAMSGEMLMPISDSTFNYSTQLSYYNDELDYDFNIVTNDRISVPMWYAQMDLYESSELDLSIRNNSDVTLQATLNGKLSLDSEVGDLDKISIGGLEFEQLILRNKPQYLRLDGGVALDASTSPGLLGFGANLGDNNNSENGASFDIGLNEISGSKTSLYLDMGLNFTGSGSANSLSGHTRLNLEANYNAGELKWESSDVFIEDIRLDANMGVMKVQGMIKFFKDDPVYGKGFQGSINSQFLETISVNANALFGNVDDYRYFYVDGSARWGGGGIGFFGLGLYGFGGGFAYNMQNERLPTTDELDQSGSSVSSDYQPDEGSMGLKATVIGGLQGDPRPWNSDVTFEVAWNTSSGLTRLDMGGDSYFMQDIMNRANPEFLGTLDMSYDFNQGIFSGTADKEIRIPASDPMITGDMPAQFYFDFQPNMGLREWYLKLGEPNDRINTTVSLTDDISFTNGSYFMVGSNIPGMPPPPAEILNELSITPPDRPNQTAIEHGAGFAHGLKLDFDVNNLDAGVCYIDVGLLAGYDISVMNWSRAGILCNGRSSFGVNQWYAKGQVYFLAKARFYGWGGTYFRTSLAALAQGGLPNPSGIKGKVQATFDVGWKTWSPSKSFYIGEICNMSVPEDSEPDVVNPYEDVEFITRLTPDEGNEQVSPVVSPEVEFNYPVDKVKDYVFSDGMGGTQSVSYKITHDVYIEENNGSQRVDLDVTPSSDNKKLTVSLNEQLKPETDYTIVAEAKLYQKNQNSWEEVTEGNRVVREVKSHVFKTTTKQEIVDADITESIPVRRQRYFKKDDHPQGSIEFKSDMSGFFSQFPNTDIKVRIVSCDGEESYLVDATVSSRQLTYSMPDLSPETIYKLEVLAVASDEEPQSQNHSGWSQGGDFATSVLWGGSVQSYVADDSNSNSGSSNTASTSTINTNAISVSTVNTNTINTQAVNTSTSGTNTSSVNNINTGSLNTNIAAADLEIDPTLFAPVLLEYHFRTSQFTTLWAKVNSVTSASAVVHDQNVGGQQVKKLEIRLKGPERFEGHQEYLNNELEFEDVNFRLQHSGGVSDNFLPGWYLNGESYPVSPAQSWTTKAKNQVLQQSSPYQAFGQEPYKLRGYYGFGTLPSYFDGPLSDNNIEYGWEPDYNNTSGGSGGNLGTYSNTQNVNFNSSYFTTNVNFTDGIDSGNQDLTTVMAVYVELEKEIYQEFVNETVSAVEVARLFGSGNQSGPGPGGVRTNPDGTAEYVPMPSGAYELWFSIFGGSTVNKTVQFNF
ncbi:hypothetical protein [Marinilabilia sp.]|uniref:hypothetical protein n=1 Tax=Marinilabilia sp. TaxID=2021252 RepID=UPI0025BBE619|nr:hypothetical protein [Marinilabilia sp.]